MPLADGKGDKMKVPTNKDAGKPVEFKGQNCVIRGRLIKVANGIAKIEFTIYPRPDVYTAYIEKRLVTIPNTM